MSTIAVNLFDTTSINDALRQLKIYAEEFEQKLDRLLERLAELAANTIEEKYSLGAYDGNNDAVVTIEPIENGYMVRVNGDDVYFLEFGTGVAAGQGYDTSVVTPPVSIKPASWSETQGTGQFAKYGYWHYNGIKYTMTVPTMGMYHGVKAIEAQVTQIAEEVFGS